MKKQNSLRVALMCGVAGGLLLASCTDSDYDLSKDIDLTMGLGSQGLAQKLGSTQNVYLRDFFTVDDSEMLDTLGSGMYYLIQDGQASVPVDVNEIAQTDDIFNVDLNADIDVLSGGTLVPAGDVDAPGVTASEPVQVNLKDIPEEILSIRRISPEDPIEMSIELIVDQPGRAAFGLKEMRGMKIEFPSYIYSSQYEEGTHTISVPDRTFSGDRSFRISGIMADSIVMGGSDAFGQEVVGGTIQAIYPFEEPVVLICNDEGKLLGLPLYRALRDEKGRIYDIVAGTFFLCGAPEESDCLESLPDKLMGRYQQKFASPEIFC